LGSRVADTLFQGADPIGQTVMINQRPFRVIGLLQPVGGSALGTEDDIIIAPITTVQTRVIRNRSAQGSDFVQLINVKAASEKQVDAVKQEVADILRVRHRITGEDDFSLTSQDDIAQTRQEVNDVLTIFLASIAGISLLVGGIGIMNIMLVSVTERTREIGIRKAIGAKRRDIMAQFLGEATLLSLGGGGIGLAAGWGVSGMLEKVTLNNQRIETLITPEIIILSVGVAVAVGVFFGIYPALRASRLDPIEALRR
jgi:putative ABC transport system permease protein